MKRYVSGKRPDYAPMESSDEEEVEFKFAKKGTETEVVEVEQMEDDVSDPRLKRLLNRSNEDVEERWCSALQVHLPSARQHFVYCLCLCLCSGWRGTGRS